MHFSIFNMRFEHETEKVLAVLVADFFTYIGLTVDVWSLFFLNDLIRSKCSRNFSKNACPISANLRLLQTSLIL